MTLDEWNNVLDTKEIVCYRFLDFLGFENNKLFVKSKDNLEFIEFDKVSNPCSYSKILELGPLKKYNCQKILPYRPLKKSEIAPNGYFLILMSYESAKKSSLCIID